MISNTAIEYTLTHLLKVALPADLPVPFHFERQEKSLCVTLFENQQMVMPLMSDEEMKDLLCGALSPQRITSADGKEQIPVFAMGTSAELDYVTLTRTLAIPYDLITPSFVLLSRLEELVSGDDESVSEPLVCDDHGRYVFMASLPAQYGFIHLPLVDEYAMLLRQWIMTYIKPEIRIKPRKSVVIPTHDVDILYRFQGRWQAFRSIFGRDLLISRSLSQVRDSLDEYREWRQEPSQDPYITAIYELVKESRQQGLKSVFFFKALSSQLDAGNFKNPDQTYDVCDPAVKQCVEMILQNGMSVGLHGSYDSYINPACLSKERQNLEHVTGQPVNMARQHYLRFTCSHFEAGVNRQRASMIEQHPSTLQTWQKTGIKDDYTLCYAEQPGFRCGTCHPYPLYDLDNDCPTDIIEHPLIVMDGSLFDYLKLDNAEAKALTLNLKARCFAVEGDFVLLWHNHLLSRQYKKSYQEVYLPVIKNQ